jgi:hypothetical protein
MKTNLRQFALRALETAKEDLRRDKCLLPVAFIVTDDEVFDFNLEFEDAKQKASVYTELVELAKRKGARAIITLNDATVRNTVETARQISGTEMSSANGVQECIFLTVSGPGIQTWSVSVPYLRAGDEIVFGNPSETTNDILNLLPGWPMNQSAALNN